MEIFRKYGDLKEKKKEIERKKEIEEELVRQQIIQLKIKEYADSFRKSITDFLNWYWENVKTICDTNCPRLTHLNCDRFETENLEFHAIYNEVPIEERYKVHVFSKGKKTRFLTTTYDFEIVIYNKNTCGDHNTPAKIKIKDHHNRNWNPDPEEMEVLYYMNLIDQEMEKRLGTLMEGKPFEFDSN